MSCSRGVFRRATPCCSGWYFCLKVVPIAFHFVEWNNHIGNKKKIAAAKKARQQASQLPPAYLVRPVLASASATEVAMHKLNRVKPASLLVLRLLLALYLSPHPCCCCLRVILLPLHVLVLRAAQKLSALEAEKRCLSQLVASATMTAPAAPISRNGHDDRERTRCPSSGRLWRR